MNTAFRASVNLNFHWGDEGLRYTFNGIEKDNELTEGVCGAHYRMNDTRLGRWFSIDPKMDKFPGVSPYVSMNNAPLIVTDPFGDEITVTEAFKNNKYANAALSLLLKLKRGKSF